MADARLQVILNLVDKVSGELEKVNDAFEKHRKQVGVAMTAVGGVITGIGALAVKSALEQEIGINRLQSALKGLDVSYANNKIQIESVISALQRKTSFADEQQREALTSLVQITGNYEDSLKALPVVLDTATGLNMDLNSASLLVAKALAGSTSMLSRYGITLEEGAGPTEVLAALTKRFGGSAEAAANPIAQLKNQLDDLMQDTIGATLLPLLRDAVSVVASVIEKISAWATAHPGLTRVIVLVVAALGGLMLILGPLLLMLPGLTIAVGLFGAAIAIATGPVGLITLAIMAAVAAGVLLWSKWDEIKDGLVSIWEGIKGVFKGGINFLIGLAEGWANMYIKAANIVIAALNSIKVSIPDWVPIIGGKSFGINLPTIPEITLPRLAGGGIVTRPTLALLGERGPEAVVPLSRAGVTIIFNAPVYGLDEFQRRVAQAVRNAALGGAFYGVKVGA